MLAQNSICKEFHTRNKKDWDVPGAESGIQVNFCPFYGSRAMKVPGGEHVGRFARLVISLHNLLTHFCSGVPISLGVAIWGLAIPRFRRRYLGLDGNTRPKCRLGRCGKNSYTACNLVRFAGPKKWGIEKTSGAEGGRIVGRYGVSSLSGVGQHRQVLASRFLKD
jgi:hypothetical protein